MLIALTIVILCIALFVVYKLGDARSDNEKLEDERDAGRGFKKRRGTANDDELDKWL